ILQRYFADFSFMFLAAAVLLAFIANENMHEGSSFDSLFHQGLSVLVGLSVVYIALLCLVPETGWYSDVYDWAYQDIVETVLFWT
ncbi:MAG: cytochrome C oxidase Cbb3, partial [Eggerthellaceae bacterium]|nr:cytochrome C oxidase Cbb3 [Eggerthellaceae bacterium]